MYILHTVLTQRFFVFVVAAVSLELNLNASAGLLWIQPLIDTSHTDSPQSGWEPSHTTVTVEVTPKSHDTIVTRHLESLQRWRDNKDGGLGRRGGGEEGGGEPSFVCLFVLLWVLTLSSRHFEFVFWFFRTMISEPDSLFKVSTPEAKSSAEPRLALSFQSCCSEENKIKLDKKRKRKEKKKKTDKKHTASLRMLPPCE